MTGKIIPYKNIPGYNLLLPPEERTIKSYVDYVLRPEYEKPETQELQVEDLLKIVEDDVETVYAKYHDGVKTVWFPMINFVHHYNVLNSIKNELYTLGITMPLCKFSREIDEITAELINIFKKEYSHPEGIFTRRLGTVQMVDKSNKHYFIKLDVSVLEKEKEHDHFQASIFHFK
ncbi:7082_t:CDS:2 [Dentiscutata erythropus]|uniref:7082_t:CDS:1 n=1 Tax=Dentiscutata erythropus TaxID=1348616 RepID=A0A9N8WCZ0_9GLOM|nr:7082_t:CDS:2 [Dentiscutata erythropus]